MVQQVSPNEKKATRHGFPVQLMILLGVIILGLAALLAKAIGLF